MKLNMKIFAVCCAATALLAVFSCKKQESTPLYEAVATILPDNGVEECYIKVNDSTVLKPTNSRLATNPFGKEVRVHCFYTDYGQIQGPDSSPYIWKSASLIELDTILTKNPVPAGGSWGENSIELVNSWMNCFEDGYLTLHFEALFGYTGTTHYINLERTEDKFTFTLRHDASSDPEIYRGRGLVAFRLKDLPVPDTGEYDLIINYLGYFRTKSVKFHCKDGVWSKPQAINYEDPGKEEGDGEFN